MYVTGHSLGAASALLLAVDIAGDGNESSGFPNIRFVQLTTFGLPRVGNSEFSAYGT